MAPAALREKLRYSFDRNVCRVPFYGYLLGAGMGQVPGTKLANSERPVGSMVTHVPDLGQTFSHVSPTW